MAHPRESILAVIAAAAAFSAGLSPEPARAQEARVFAGPYLAADVSAQSIVGGADINGVDILVQETRPVWEFNGGFRHQFPVGLVLGIEGGIGIADGDMELIDSAAALDIEYDNNFQYSIGGTIGWAFGAEKDFHAFAYLKETKRKFNVRGFSNGVAFMQDDRQGMLRFGGGIEKRVYGPLHARAMVGTGRANFGDRPTNFDPKKKVEFSIGVVAQF